MDAPMTNGIEMKTNTNKGSSLLRVMVYIFRYWLVILPNTTTRTWDSNMLHHVITLYRKSKTLAFYEFAAWR